MNRAEILKFAGLPTCRKLTIYNVPLLARVRKTFSHGLVLKFQIFPFLLGKMSRKNSWDFRYIDFNINKRLRSLGQVLISFAWKNNIHRKMIRTWQNLRQSQTAFLAYRIFKLNLSLCFNVSKYWAVALFKLWHATFSCLTANFVLFGFSSPTNISIPLNNKTSLWTFWFWFS